MKKFVHKKEIAGKNSPKGMDEFKMQNRQLLKEVTKKDLRLQNIC